MTSPVSMPAGHAIVAEDLDAYENLTAAWTSYTPTWASFGTQPVLGDGTLTGKYMRAGKFVAFTLTLTAGSTTTFGTSQYTFTLPFTSLNASVFAVLFQDASTGFRYAGTAGAGAGASTIGITVFTNGTPGFDSASPVTMATSDSVTYSGVYEAS